jgi:hypothetical protein
MAIDIEVPEVDFAAVDAEVARGKAADAPKADKAAVKEPITVETEDAPGEEVAKPVLTPEAGIEKLKEQLKASETARLEAEARERDTAQAEAAARGEVQKSQLEQIVSGIERATQLGDQLEVQYAASAAAGDWATAAKIQRTMADTAAELQTLKNGKMQLERAPKPIPRAPIDKVEEFASRCTPRSATWVRAHPEFVRDAKKNAQMIAAHQFAIQDYAPDSDDYFRSIEETLRITPRPEVRPAPNGHDTEVGVDPMEGTAATPVAPRRAPAAAPVTRSGGATRTQNMKLSPEQVEIAIASFPQSKTPLEDYARELIELRKEKRLS